MSQENAQLLTHSCTTGWTDWLWGELWLLPDGLLRLSTGSRGLIAGLTAGTAAAEMPGSVRQIPAGDIPDLLAGRGRNRWISRDQVSDASLRKGLMQGRLRVVLYDGTRIKLLWLKDDTVHEVVRSTLEGWLGDRLKVR